jgi:hypothetical protein
VARLAVDRPRPRDIDTFEDYHAVTATIERSAGVALLKRQT